MGRDGRLKKSLAGDGRRSGIGVSVFVGGDFHAHLTDGVESNYVVETRPRVRWS